MQEKARKEAIDILGDGDDIAYPTAAQCSDMKYIYMIMKEVNEPKFRLPRLLISIME
jgi:hypothetical protein